MIAKLLGQSEAGPAHLTARLAGTLRANDQRQDYVRCGLRMESDGSLSAGLIVRPPGDPARAPGDAVAVLRLD
jgi:molybdopterin biosynthesis enzyme